MTAPVSTLARWVPRHRTRPDAPARRPNARNIGGFTRVLFEGASEEVGGEHLQVGSTRSWYTLPTPAPFSLQFLTLQNALDSDALDPVAAVPVGAAAGWGRTRPSRHVGTRLTRCPGRNGQGFVPTRRGPTMGDAHAMEQSGGLGVRVSTGTRASPLTSKNPRRSDHYVLELLS